MRISISINGTTALICNRFPDESAIKVQSGSSSSATAGSKGTPREQAEKKLYTSESGKLIIPQPNLMRCLVDGGRFYKAGKKQVTTQKESMLFSCMEIPEAEIPLIHDEPWRVDSRAVVIPSTGGRVISHRPLFDSWGLSFLVELEEDFVNETLFRDIVDAAGKRIGLGDFRPAKKGPYGKFKVTEWKVEKSPK